MTQTATYVIYFVSNERQLTGPNGTEMYPRVFHQMITVFHGVPPSAHYHVFTDVPRGMPPTYILHGFRGLDGWQMKNYNSSTLEQHQ